MKPLESLYQDALVALNTGRLPDAERHFKKFLKNEPNHIGALNLLTVVLMKLGRFAEAEKYIAAAVKLNQNSDASFHNYGLISKELGKLEQACDQFSKALQINGSAFETWSSRGAVFNSLGDFERAIADFDKAISLNPNYHDAHYNKGQSLHELKRYDEALAAYDRALSIRPNMAEAWLGRGNVLFALNRFGDAAGSYERALSSNPDLPEAWLGRGNVLATLGRFGEATACFERALSIKPALPEALLGQAKILMYENRFDEMLACCDKCLSLKSDMPGAWYWRGAALTELKLYEDAVAAFDRALSLNPEMADVWIGRGNVFVAMGRYEDALVAFDEAIKTNPNLIQSYANKAQALTELGRFEEAGKVCREALAIDPEAATIYAQLLMSKKVKPDDPDLAALEALAEKLDPLATMHRANVGFVLGKSHADIGNHRKAFEHWINANALMRKLVDYDEAAISRRFERIEQVFSPELIGAKSGHGDPRPTPIFVLGMPRSGTTLVEQIISSHPAVHGAGELPFINELLDRVRGRNGEVTPYPDFVGGLDGRAIRQFAADYVEKLSRVAPGSARVTDKMPGNFDYIGMIHLAFPNAKIIHTLRDPVDNCVSCFSMRFEHGHHYAYDLAELGRFYRRYQRLMAHWHRVLPPGRILDVRYEDVVSDIEGQARRILAHCDLDWDPRCLAFHETKRPVRTASLTQVRQPIYASSVGRWQVYEEFLGPLLAELGLKHSAPAD